MNVTKPDIEALYGEESERARKRYAHLQEKFTEEFGEAELRYFSAPGRTEIIGNHTDHNGGQILAGSITPVSYTHLDVYKRQPSPLYVCERPGDRREAVG